MTRYILARIVLTLAGVAVWGYGQRQDLAQVRVGGMAILLVALLLRFAPRRWFGDEPS